MRECFWCKSSSDDSLRGKIYDLRNPGTQNSIYSHLTCMEQFKNAIMLLIRRELGDYEPKHIKACFRKEE